MTWQQSLCVNCSCLNGTISCSPKKCPVVECNTIYGTLSSGSDIIDEDPCCPPPECHKSCFRDGNRIAHNDVYRTVLQSNNICVECLCEDGDFHTPCTRVTCPPLNCPIHEQYQPLHHCCKVCRGIDYCALGHNCSSNADCVTDAGVNYKCYCKMGYYGNGFTCQDIDECTGLYYKDEHWKHNCGIYTTCINTPGSFRCECLPGYIRKNNLTCEEHNECITGAHSCHEHAVCSNTPGSYRCKCSPGYTGDGINCEPVCTTPCAHGGTCIGPDICACPYGFIGKRCEQDIDECSLGIDGCHERSTCINIPGWFFCECKHGYYSAWPDNDKGKRCQEESHESSYVLTPNKCSAWKLTSSWPSLGSGCPLPGGVGGADANECIGQAGYVSTCHHTADCLNQEGGYVCRCGGEGQSNSTNSTTPTCSLSCILDGVEYENGASWKKADNHCHTCSCTSGVVRCTKGSTCDCNSATVDLLCCPECDNSKKCLGQDGSTWYSNGDRWTYRCHTCECLYGEVDCWQITCPRSDCAGLNIEMSEHDCCPKCSRNPCEIKGLNTHDKAYRECVYEGKTYLPGVNWTIGSDSCPYTCQCKGGHICCSFNTDHCESQQESLVSGGGGAERISHDQRVRVVRSTAATTAGRRPSRLRRTRRTLQAGAVTGSEDAPFDGGG